MAGCFEFRYTCNEVDFCLIVEDKDICLIDRAYEHRMSSTKYQYLEKHCKEERNVRVAPHCLQVVKQTTQ